MTFLSGFGFWVRLAGLLPSQLSDRLALQVGRGNVKASQIAVPLCRLDQPAEFVNALGHSNPLIRLSRSYASRKSRNCFWQIGNISALQW